MTDLILWNSTSSRRRSPTDDFLDNGLSILRTYIESKGYAVEVVDWANSIQWEAMTPRTLARLNGMMASRLLGSRNGRKRSKKLLGAVFMASQELTTKMQQRSQRKMIRELARHVRDTGCKIVGIKTWYGETYVTARQFARELRKVAPEVLVVAGGPHASTYREAVLEDQSFDFAVVGEGEDTLLGMLALAKECESRDQLVAAVSRAAELGKLENTVYRSGDGYKISDRRKLNANTKTVPRYNTNLPGKTKIHVIVESLGCPWGKCSFCTHSCTYGSYSIRKPESVADEFEQMVANGIGIFRYAGSSTTLAHAKRIAQEILDRKLQVVYSMFGRAERKASDPAKYQEVVDAYRLLIRSGFRAIFLGAESGEDSINEHVMNKGASRADIVATVRAMREASKLEGTPIDIGISLIYPTPTMDMVPLEQIKQADITLVEETKPDSILVSPPAPFPGSDWFERRDEFGFEIDDNFVRDMLEYDYVLYKPLYMWPDIGLKLNGMSLKQIFEQCGSLRTELERRGFVTEVTDVQFLMLRAAGYSGVDGVIEFKNHTQHSILSCDYRWINRLQERVNQASLEQANKNSASVKTVV